MWCGNFITPIVYILHPDLKRFKPCFDVLGLRGGEVSKLYLIFKSISSTHKNHEFVEVSNAMVMCFNVNC